jgi:hypothetical protein
MVCDILLITAMGNSVLKITSVLVRTKFALSSRPCACSEFRRTCAALLSNHFGIQRVLTGLDIMGHRCGCTIRHALSTLMIMVGVLPLQKHQLIDAFNHVAWCAFSRIVKPLSLVELQMEICFTIKAKQGFFQW